MRWTHIARTRFTRLSLFSSLTLAACSGAQTEEERVGVVQSAVTRLPGDFSPDTPTITVNEGKTGMVTRVGANTNATDLLSFAHFNRASANLLPEWLAVSETSRQTQYRPLRIWNSNTGHSDFTTIFNDAANSDFSTDLTVSQRVLPTFNGAPLGPPSALDMMTGATTNTCAFGAYSSGGSRVIMQSCTRVGFNEWEDWGLELPNQGPTPSPTPNTSPMVYRRSPNSDSLLYGCGASATQACESRINASNVVATFTISFGSGAFMASTRPTGISNNPTTSSAKPWFFAATLNGSTRSLLSRRETSALDAATPTYQTDAAMTIESTTANVTYSTPMPYNRSDGSLGVVYSRTLAGSTTRIFEAVWSGSAWSTKEVYDTGLVLPAGTEPFPNAETIDVGPTGIDITRDAIVFRQPGTAASDVIVLWQGPSVNDGYSKIMLPQSQTAGINYASSAPFEDPIWNPTGITPAGVAATGTAGPSGALTEELREKTGTGAHGITQNFFVGNRAVPFRWTIYLKKDSRSAAKLTLDTFDDAASSVSAFVDLNAGVISSFATTGSGSYLGGTSEAVGNGWYRVSLVGKPTSAAGSLISIKAFLLSGVNGNTSYAGDTTKRLFASSPELMVYNGPFAGAPAPTNLSAAAGNAQVSLGWTASSGAASYNVYRSTSAGAEGGTPVATGIAGTTYTNTGLTNGTNYFFKVAAVRAGGPSLLSNEANATPVAPVTTIFMNCGGAASGSWLADTNAGGFTRSWAGNAVNTTLLTGTIPPQAVLQAGRLGNLTYNFTGYAASSSHTITLYFVENFFTATGKRIFTVSANGTAKLSSFDIFAAAGAQFKAVQRSFTATADATGKIALTFVPSVDNASIEGIVVQ
jgi:hypothetical protein